jgi:threonine dehydrogenase-like Zn-dependent dehydrogenase
MRAAVLTAPRSLEVRDVPVPTPAPGDALVAVHRVGLCGTDVEFFEGTMSYLHSGHARFPLRLGHEWMGVVEAVGDRADETWVGRAVIGDTMLGCGVCDRCRTNRGSMDPALGALVEPGGNAVRAVRAAEAGPGRRVLVLGTGTIGLLSAMFARAAGAEVHLLGRSARSDRSRRFARELGFAEAWTLETLPDLAWHAVIDASNAPELPALATRLVEPGGRIALIGLAGEPSLVDTRDLALADVTAVGILSGSHGLDEAIDAYATGRVDPAPLVAATVPLSGVGSVLAGERPAGAGDGPKVHVDPRLGPADHG